MKVKEERSDDDNRVEVVSKILQRRPIKYFAFDNLVIKLIAINMKSINSLDSTDNVDEATKLLPMFARTPAPARIRKVPVSKPPSIKFRRHLSEKDLRSIHYLRSQLNEKGKPMTYVQIGKKLWLRPTTIFEAFKRYKNDGYRKIN